MKKKKVPLRKCVVTNEMKPKQEMVRVVKDKEDSITIDPSGRQNGRGAYISLDPTILDKARKGRALDRSLGITLSEEFYDELSEHINYQYARKQIQ
ncbi:MAG: YlxR family protein [Atopococcus tabaci]|mgnify:CR=1 FL=1|uniref:YlxR family protein n=1 Tax=Atopococcus tabaci TaxID=269774 RepID=A0AA43U739_9LACT|nr:YlxR family protein [Atopococcus tabaci]